LNTLGQVIQSFDNVAVDGSEVQVDLSSLANGVYNIRVQNANSIWTGSVIKN